MKRVVLLAGALLWPLVLQAEEEIELGLQQVQIKGLLVTEVSGGEVAGVASQMNATVMGGEGDAFSIRFNQDVGETMVQATQEVEKFIRLRHAGKLPKGKVVELAFAEKYSPKDGPSAAVVSALLCDAIVSGHEIDQGFAATGDMTATGEVRAVGGVSSKVSGAIKRGCTLVGIPKSNQDSVTDNYLLDGISALYDIQIFTMESFDEARDLASMERSENLAKAIEEFALVQGALRRNDKSVANAKVLEKLKEIVQLAPNHLSARVLYLHGTRQAPKNLSLAGSITGIDKASVELLEMIQSGAYQDSQGNDDVLFKLTHRLNELGPALDPKSRPYARSLQSLAEKLREVRSKKIINDQVRREFSQVANRVDIERERLLNDREVREALMLDE